MNNDRAAETGLESVLLPHELIFVILVRKELLRVELHFAFLLVLVGGVGGLFLGSAFGLILQVEADGLLEINLDGTTLVLSLKGVVNLHVDLGTVESTVTVIESPRLSEGVKSLLKS